MLVLFQAILDRLLFASADEPAIGFVGEEEDVVGVMNGEEERGCGWTDA